MVLLFEMIQSVFARVKTSDHFTDGLTFCRQKQSRRHGLETMNAKSCMICLCKKVEFFLKGLSKFIVNIVDEHDFI